MTHSNATLVSRHGPWICTPDTSDTAILPWYNPPYSKPAISVWLVPFHDCWLVRMSNVWTVIEHLSSLDIPVHRSVRLVVLNNNDVPAVRPWLHPDVNVLSLEHQLGRLPSWSTIYEKHNLALAIASLDELISWIVSVLRIDFSLYESANQAWRAGAKNQCRSVGSNQPRNVERWFRTLNDHPWQEVRTLGSKTPMAGVVLDMRNAYSASMVASMFPYPGPWKLSSSWVKHPCAMGWCRFYPKDAIGRFAHPFATLDAWFSRRYLASECMEGWFHVDTIRWMQRHGQVELLQCAVPTRWGPHPFKGKTEYLIDRLHSISNVDHPLAAFYKSSLKRKLASSHSWVWTPKSHWVCSDPKDSQQEHWDEYGAAVGPYFRTSGSYVDPVLGYMSSHIEDEQSGSYMWTSWTRMLVRSCLLRGVDELCALGMRLEDLLYLNVDSMHWKTSRNDARIESWLEKNETVWKIDYDFDDAFYAAPGAYRILRNGQWCGDLFSPHQLLRWNLGRSNVAFQGGQLRARRWSSAEHAVFKPYHESALLRMWTIHQEKSGMMN